MKGLVGPNFLSGPLLPPGAWNGLTPAMTPPPPQDWSQKFK